MNSKMKLLAAGAALVVFIGVSMGLYRYLSRDNAPQNRLEDQGGQKSPDEPMQGGETPPEQESEKIPAPDFTVTDGDGNEVKLSDFLGKPVVLNFWASWCSPCKGEMPEFDKVWAELGEEVEFMMINATDGMRETQKSAQQYIEEQGFSFPVYFDTEQEANITYGITSLPSTLFIDKEGYVITGAEGQIDEDLLRLGISMITGEEGE